MADVSSVDKRSLLSSEPRVPGYPYASAGENDDLTAVVDISSTGDFVENKEQSINSKTSWLGFHDIKLSIIDPKTKQLKYILDGVSGQAYGGEVYGIIGASGGGKTTLLTLLSGRIGKLESLRTKCNTEGRIKLNNTLMSCSAIKNFEYLRRATAFVLQEDILLPTELAREAITVSAMLRLDSARLTTRVKQKKVSKILKALDLSKCSETKIGGPRLRGLSGGERKRVSIGIELVTDPDILMLDEPTSGLDSNIAYQTMLLLRKLANSGKMVVASIHQPSSEIFNTLDRVLILASGKAIYEGRVDKLAEYLISIGYQCPIYSNIADYVLQKVCGNETYFINKWEEFTQSNSDSTTALVKRRMSDQTSQPLMNITRTKMAPICLQMSILTRRQFVIFIRDTVPTFVRFTQAIFTALLEGALWWQLTPIDDISVDPNDPTDTEMMQNLQNRFGAIFYATTFAAMNAIMTANLTFPSQRLVFQKERVGDWYYTTLWIIAKSCIDLPITFLVTLPFSVIIKYMINFHAEFWQIFIVLSLVALVADSMGFVLGCIAKSPEIAAQLTPVTIIPLFLFSNFFVSNSTIPIWLRWIQYIDCFYYGTELLCIWEFEGMKSKNGVPSGDVFLDRFDMDSDNVWRDIYALLILFVGFRIFAIGSLLKNNGI